MFRKVHYRLTLLCAGITTLILFTMSLVYLYVSETGLKQNNFLSFQRDMSTLIANFEHQTVITQEWLSQMENSNSYLIFVTDNGVPFLFNERKQSERLSRTQSEAHNFFESVYSITTLGSAYSSYHTEFEFTSSYKEEYYVCVAVIPHETGNTEILVLSPLDQLNAQMKIQRIRFSLINLAAIVILSLFSFFFTKKLLIPIEKNRKEQIQFVAAASHELRTPLAVILSCVSAIQGHNGKKASPQEEESFLTTIRAEGQRMSHLIDDMLLLSQADTHSFRVQMKPVEPDTLLLNSYEAFEPISREKHISFRISLPETAIPPCLCDGERLQQLTAILLHNAISYTPEGGTVTLSLTLKEDYKQKTFTLAVIDNGIGIPDDEKEKIFRRFYRSDQSRSTKDHFGLGLCIADEIVRSLNGSIHAEDTPGGGSTFLVRLPFIPV